MKLKSIVAAVSLAAASLSAVAATNVNSVIDMGETPFERIGIQGSFADTFAFHFDAAGYASGDAYKYVTVRGGNIIKGDINSFSFALYQGVVGSGTLLVSGVAGINQFAIAQQKLAAGDYYFQVAGSGTGVIGYNYGHYDGTITLAPVPEPETYAMLLAGLGVMGAVARRRSKA